MYDYHMHSTPWSPDARDTSIAMMEAAARLGIRDICFTEHVDEGYPHDPVFDFDFAKNAAAFECLKKEAAHLPVTLHRGIEIGLQPHLYESMTTRLQSDDFEFIIASTHMVDGKDPIWESYLEGKDKRQAFGDYLHAVYDMVCHFQKYHVVGHIGYPTKAGDLGRSAWKNDVVLHYDELPDLLDSILTKIIQTGHGIEVNTSGYLYTDEPIPSFSIIERYFALGGEIITIGSDAHDAASIGRYFPQTLARLQTIGFRFINVFREGKCWFEPIGD